MPAAAEHIVPARHPQQVNCRLQGDKCSCWSKLVEVLGLSLTDRGVIRPNGFVVAGRQAFGPAANQERCGPFKC